MSEENMDELEMMVSAFTDDIAPHPRDKRTLIVSLPHRFVLHLTVPPRGYPEAAFPALFVESGPNAQLVAALSARLARAVRDDVPLGGPMLLQVVALAQGLAEEVAGAGGAGGAGGGDGGDGAPEPHRAESAEPQSERAAAESRAVEVWAGPPISDRKSKFVAHMARVDSVARVEEVVEHVRTLRHVAEAAHPAIYAYRFTDAAGVLHKDFDDDGETGASVKIMFLLDHMEVDGYVVVVTRWFGGILLGPDRFKHIMEVAKNILLTIPSRELELRSRETENKNRKLTKRKHV